MHMSCYTVSLFAIPGLPQGGASQGASYQAAATSQDLNADSVEDEAIWEVSLPTLSSSLPMPLDCLSSRWTTALNRNLFLRVS